MRTYTKLVAFFITCLLLCGCKEDAEPTALETLPLIPTLSSPPNDATEIPVPVTLIWDSSRYASTYSLQVSTDRQFATIVYDTSWITITNKQAHGLRLSTKYYWRVNATNMYGTSGWSAVWNFTTVNPSCPGVPTVTYAGKTYNTVQIGAQCWLKENLDVGTMVRGSANQTDNDNIEKYCYHDDTANCNIYGGLYQWNEAMQYKTTAGTQGICPSGWHIPTDEDFDTLATKVGHDGNALKAIGQGIDGGAGTNTSGFSALLAGYRVIYGDFGYFNYFGLSAYVWISTSYSSTSVIYRRLYDINSLIEWSFADKNYGFSVRCLKD